MKKVIFIIVLLCSAIMPFLQAQERSAVIICARSGSQSLFDENKKYTVRTIELLKKAGINNVQCFIEGGAQTIPSAKAAYSSDIQDALKKMAATLKNDDELWLFIYGYANMTGKKLSIATEGGRLSGNELAAIVKTISAKKYIFCLNLQSYPLMELLKDKSTFILSAASNDNQLNPPLLPGFLLERWVMETDKPFNEVLCGSVKELNDYFLKNSMAAAEIPVISVGGELYKYPFDVSVRPLKPAGFTIAADKKAADVSNVGSNEKNGKKEISGDKTALNVMPANDETIKIINDAKQMAKEYSAYYAFYMSAETECTLNIDNTVKSLEKETIYINDDAGAGHYKRMSFSDAPPYSEFHLRLARIIYPDGKYLDVKADKFLSKNSGAFYSLEFPGILPGCVIVLNTEFNYRSESNIPFIQNGFHIQKQVPVIDYTLKIQSPLKKEVFFKVVNGTAEMKTSAGVYSKVTEFRFKKVPAFEPLPYDPPADEILTKVLVSYTATWEQFKKWAEAMFDGVEKTDDKTAVLVKELCSNASSDTGKVRAIYEFLCNLRYDTTPSGARAFRPRLPSEVCTEKYGDCKDKANALVSMAALVGIKGYVALVKRGGRVLADFPSWQFNHAVAYFPELEKGGGLWCDPTDTSTVFGALPPGDIGCDAFIMNGKTPEFRKIQSHDKRKNIFQQDIVFNVSSDEKFTGKVTYRTEGLQDYFLRIKFRDLTPLQKKNVAQDMINKCFMGAYVDSLTHSAGTDLAEPFTVTVDISGDYWPLVRDNIQMPVDLWGPFSMKGRAHPLFINDGQPFRVCQTVKVNGSSLNGKGQWNGTAGPLSFKCSYEKNNAIRTVEVDVADGLINSEDYEKCVSLIRKLYSKIK